MDPEALIGMHLELGVNVSFVVEVLRKTDRLGRVHSTKYRFLRASDGQERLFEHGDGSIR
ncbi:hypothetical protein ACWEFD_33885 [Streptomyces ardesiacus]